jgi:hypothetical protein
MYEIYIFLSTCGAGYNDPMTKTIHVSPFSLNLCAQHAEESWHKTLLL